MAANQSPARKLFTVALGATLALPLAACDIGTGPNSGGQTQVFLAQGSSGSSQNLLPSMFLASASAQMGGNVSLSAVSSINVTITQVQALPANGDTANENKWVSLDVSTSGAVNLLALPAAAEIGIQLARGDLPAGSYGNLRLRYSEATITLKEDVTVGGFTYAKNKAHPLTVSSGAQTGIKIPTAGFTVTEDSAAAVTVVFDGSASVQGIQAAGPTGIRMTPVLTSRRK
ncbi:MAG: DUF4382 domain-containing protein [Gemmatimonadota bacterium]|jgi:hypothetical protein|nr:DUF4382 domain-containing protein [Gemmatimonadota bacterium]